MANASQSTGVSPDGWLALFVAVVLGVPTLVWAIRGPKRTPHRLEYVFWHTSRLLNLPIRSIVEVTVNGRPVRNAWQRSIRFVNTGTEPIRPGEWQEPIRLVFPEGTNPISSALSAIKPNSLQIETAVEGQTVTVMPVLLNRGDLFEIQIVGDGPAEAPDMLSRIANLPTMTARKSVYPPGNGPEGRLETGNKVIYSIFTLIGFGLTAALLASAVRSNSAAGGVFAAGVFLSFDVLLPLFIWSADKRRDVWRPTSLVTDAKQPSSPHEEIAAAEVATTVTIGADAEVSRATPLSAKAMANMTRVLEMVASVSSRWRVYRDPSGEKDAWVIRNMLAGNASNVVVLALNTQFILHDLAQWNDLYQDESPGVFWGKLTNDGRTSGVDFEIQWDDELGDRYQETVEYRSS